VTPCGEGGGPQNTVRAAGVAVATVHAGRSGSLLFHGWIGLCCNQIEVLFDLEDGSGMMGQHEVARTDRRRELDPHPEFGTNAWHWVGPAGRPMRRCRPRIIATVGFYLFVLFFKLFISTCKPPLAPTTSSLTPGTKLTTRRSSQPTRSQLAAPSMAVRLRPRLPSLGRPVPDSPSS
jgi:hypothetical protein